MVSYSKSFGSCVGVVLGMALLLMSGGCEQRSLRVGVVDTERIVRENPKFMELNVVLSDERSKLYSQIPRGVLSMTGDQKKALQEKLAKDAAERSSKFDKLYRESMKKLQEEIQVQAGEVAKDKGIDLVVVNTMNYPAVLYTSGENVTLDILLKMDGSAE